MESTQSNSAIGCFRKTVLYVLSELVCY